MTKPEYLISYYPYSKTVSRIYKVIGDTDCYWKIQHNENCIGYVNKRTLRSKGGDIQYYADYSSDKRTPSARSAV